MKLDFISVKQSEVKANKLTLPFIGLLLDYTWTESKVQSFIQLYTLLDQIIVWQRYISNIYKNKSSILYLIDLLPFSMTKQHKTKLLTNN